MRHLVTSILSLAFSASASADIVQRVIRSSHHNVVVKVAAESIKCTVRGYMSPQLKLSVPDLDILAQFDHRVPGEELPCMTAGACVKNSIDEKPPLTPADLIDPANSVQVMPLHIYTVETIERDLENKKCYRHIREQLKGKIRAQTLTHEKTNSAEYPSDLCQVAFRIGFPVHDAVE